MCPAEKHNWSLLCGFPACISSVCLPKVSLQYVGAVKRDSNFLLPYKNYSKISWHIRTKMNRKKAFIRNFFKRKIRPGTST
ncbi:hypothetical protein HMPREF3213_03021 [Heyndrickxia coagulans]|uniref:Uncharacterized protein n=1 Tax=Heyndrickxia coagulans TaxID=1398 RepID=A0A133KFN7_HEYCO|nr:hypothetical protein HMPREF3213_03021 [Heyndrickxia coagulans]